MYDREKVRADLDAVIRAELRRLGIGPNDGMKAIMHAHEIWQALVVSGKMPRQMTFDGMMNNLLQAVMG